MDAKDQSIWDLQVRELQEGLEEDQKFLEFFLEWAAIAEAGLEQLKLSLWECTWRGFLKAEAIHERAPVHVYSRGISFLLKYWVHGEQLRYQLPLLERRLVIEDDYYGRHQGRVLTLEDLPEE